MSFLSIGAIAVALAMDAFAVSVASGITIRNCRLRHAFTMAAWFAFFQALMPFLGWLAGMQTRHIVESVEHWIIFGLLTFIGGKMIVESSTMDEVEKKTNPMDVHILFVLSMATSVDAFAAGVSFALLAVSIVAPIAVIGAITFVMSFGGVWLGDKCGHLFERKVELVGGVLLILIGLKVLVGHFLGG